jgi:hypothetical protein
MHATLLWDCGTLPLGVGQATAMLSRTEMNNLEIVPVFGATQCSQLHQGKAPCTCSDLHVQIASPTE